MTWNAHDLVRPLVAELVERTRAARQRVVLDRHDAEAIHDVRVAMRRLRTVLRCARSLYGRDALGSIEWALRELSVATSALRDEEVLVETLAQAELTKAARQAVDRWLDWRSRYARGLRRRAVALLSGPDLDKVLTLLLARLEARPVSDPSVGEFASRRLEWARRGVWELLPIDDDSGAALHRLRIRFKRLRYAAEMLGGFMARLDAAAPPEDGGGRAPANAAAGAEPAAGGHAAGAVAASVPAPRPDYAAVAELAARMQKDLGAVHDADVALAAARRARGLGSEQRRAVVAALATLRRRLAQQTLDWLDQLPIGLFGPAGR